MMKTIHDALREACNRSGLVFKTVPADGKWYRADSTDEQEGKGSGEIKLFLDGKGGLVRNFKTDDEAQPFFVDDALDLTEGERRERTQRREEAIKAARAEDRKRRTEAAAQAIELWAKAVPAGADHPYLKKKNVKPYGIRTVDGLLIVPVLIDGVMSSVQYISGEGEKKYLWGGQKSGGYFLIGDAKADGVVCIAEGYATGATIHEATGYPVAVAFDAGNIRSVASSIRRAYPNATLIVCGDDDHATAGNPGRTKAMAAAQSAGAVAVFPKFGTDRSKQATDFNDMAAVTGMASVRKCIEAAAMGATRRVELVCGSDIIPRPTDWLWKEWLAAGKMQILAGAPGCGKTTIAMAIAATVTTGGKWPDGTACEPGNVVIWSGEDDPADTLIPRLVLSGANLRRVFFISGIREGQESRTFDPANDISDLHRTLACVGNVRLLIVDPIVSAVSGDSHKNAEVRRDLQKLVDLAADIRCALVGITHLTKGTQGREPLERITGSLAFGALTRVAWFAIKPQPDAEGNIPPRLFLRIKSSNGPDGGGFEYDLCQGALPENLDIVSSYARWGKPVEGDNRAIIAEAESVSDDGTGGSLGEAKDFLLGMLRNGPMTTKAIYEKAEGAEISSATLRRAQKYLGIIAEKENGRNGQWKWHLPGTCSKNSGISSPQKVEHLEHLEQVQPPGKADCHFGLTESGVNKNLFDAQAKQATDDDGWVAI